MARSEPRQVNGSVAAYSVRLSVTGSFAHEFTVGGSIYTHFSQSDVALMRVGDTVRFNATPRTLRKTRRRYFSIEESSIDVLSTLIPHGTDQGYIYVLAHPAMKGLRKIGFTRDTPRARAAALSGSTGVPGKYLVEWSMPVSGDPLRIERAVHASLSKQRYQKEFFKVGLAEATRAIQLAYADLYPEAVAEIEQGLQVRAAEVVKAREEAETKLRIEQHKRAEQQRLASPEFKWLSAGTLLVHAHTEFVGPAVTVVVPTFLQRLVGHVPEKPERVSVEIIANDPGAFAPWGVRIDGWFRGAPWSYREDAPTLETALRMLDSRLKGRQPDRMNVLVRVPTSMLDDPKDPPLERLSSDGLLLEVHGPEIADYRLRQVDLRELCAQMRAIAGKPEPVSPKPEVTKPLDSRGRSPFPFGSKDRARELLTSSGMTRLEIEVYLDQYAD